MNPRKRNLAVAGFNEHGGEISSSSINIWNSEAA
jgi:hypothetical protein